MSFTSAAYGTTCPPLIQKHLSARLLDVQIELQASLFHGEFSQPELTTSSQARGLCRPSSIQNITKLKIFNNLIGIKGLHLQGAFNPLKVFPMM